MSASTVHSRLKKAGIGYPGPRLPVLLDRDRPSRWWDAGVDVDEIAAQAGCSDWTVRHEARRLRLCPRPALRPERRPPGGIDPDRLRERPVWAIIESGHAAVALDDGIPSRAIIAVFPVAATPLCQPWVRQLIAESY